jgi:DNA-binding transcriptional LysR family regulator
MSRTSDLRVGDVATFLAVNRCASVTGAARALGTSASQVSKAIARLEKQLQIVLLSRSSHGVALTDEALRVVPRLEEVLLQLERVTGAEPAQRTLTLAGSSWVIEALLPSVTEATAGVRFCGLEMPPAMMRAHVTDNSFDLSLIVGSANLPPTWHRATAGELSFGLFARPGLARSLGPQPVAVEQVAAVPFIVPVYSVNGRFVEADDDCPLSFSERHLGHKVQTIRVALELAARIDQLVYGPVVAAHRELTDGRLVEVSVRGWRQSANIMLSCNPDKVRIDEHVAILTSVKKTLSQLAVH